MECTVTLRGKCKEMCEKLVRDNPELTMVRGFYWCPIWNKDEPHWWCKDKQGNIVDPTVNQFPSKGVGYYTEFDGFITCEMCGKRVPEDEAQFYGNYACCSYNCMVRMVL